GLLGAGRSELLEGMFGVRGHAHGEILLEQKRFVPKSAARSLKSGLALVPAERGRQGIFATLSARDNVMLPYLAELGRPWWRNRRREQAEFVKTGEDLRLKPLRASSQAWTYSGGNQQKLVVGRWLTQQSRVRVLMLDEPNQGIDVGAREDLYELIRRFAEVDGRAVLFTSSDPEEAVVLADRVYVLARGRIVGELQKAEIAPEQLLHLAHDMEAAA
ncbi:MAG: sugar ABC transporter ATP-binding protein, partial [Actinobacteria bacterium]|nr:sugar ABC transporter ATP-binding protein [Actinomycetota bacterium]